jgi:hypothetical protein
MTRSDVPGMTHLYRGHTGFEKGRQAAGLD